jgi:DNA-binding MarR family transcriptional regulator
VPGDQELRRAARAIAFAARRLERATGHLTLAQYRVLALVVGGDERSSRLAAQLAVARPTVTAVVDGLAERGLVRREVNRVDRRSLRLVITPAGRDALEAAEAAMAGALGDVVGATADPDALLRALGDLECTLATLLAARSGDAAAEAPR